MAETGLNILFVYDNDESRCQLEEILHASDIEAFRLESVPAHLVRQDSALNSYHDICIIESVGLCATQLVQGLKVMLNCPIIVLTWDSGSEVLRALRAGATDCIIRNHLTPAALEESILSSIDQVKHRNALDQYERWYLGLVENSEDLIFTQDLNGTFSSINRMVERLTGYTQDEVIGMNIRQLVAPEYQDLMMQRYQQMFSDHRPCNRELVIVSKHWQRVQVQLSSHLIYKHGSPVGIQGTMRIHHNVVSLRATG